MDASFHIRPFGFDRVFDHASGRTTPASEDDLQSRIAVLEAELAHAALAQGIAVANAREEGFAGGLSHARVERESALLAAADALHAVIEEVEAKMDELADEVIREAAGVAHAAAEILAARALAAAPAAAVDEAVGRVLRQVARGQAIDIRVHPDLVPDVERLIASRQAGDRRCLNLTVSADTTLASGDSHIHWDQGGVVLNAAARAVEVRAALADVLPG